MDYIKLSLALCFILFLSSCGPIRGSAYYSRSVNEWGGNRWNGNVVSVTTYDTIPWTPNVGVWYDPITKAKGVSFGVKLIDFKIKE